MNNTRRRVTCLIFALLLSFTALLSACGSSGSEGGTSANSSSSETTTLKFLLWGDEPVGFDAVLEEFEKQTADTLHVKLDITFVSSADYKEKLNLEITSGSDYDLVFDAEWIYLKTLSKDGYYADLSEYWNNDDYPGLKSAFSEEIIQYNQYFDQQCVIPISRTYGGPEGSTGIACVFYRQDWADDWGLGKITNFDDLQTYWDKCKEESITPASLLNTRGYFQLMIPEKLDAAGIRKIPVAGLNYYAYIDNSELIALAPEGAGDEAFADFPEDYRYDFGMERYDQFAEWRSSGYSETDSLNQTDDATQFYSGLAGSFVKTLDDAENVLTEIAKYSPEAEVGFFPYQSAVYNMEEEALATSYMANNFLAIPSDSKNTEKTMAFLDWLYSSEENHDLFELGIEGVDWENNGDGTYKSLSEYRFNGFIMTWCSNYVKFPDIIHEDMQEYMNYELQESTFYANALPGFTFDQTPVETQIAQTKAISDMIFSTRLHGILSDGSTQYDNSSEMHRATLDTAYKNGLDTIEEELTSQIETFLAK